MSGATIVLVPGACGLPEYYDKLTNTVRANGYSINVLHNPSVGESTGKGRNGVHPTMHDDAAFIASELTKLADQAKDIVLGLTKAQRSSNGKAGGVVRLAYMTCLVPKLGETAGAVLAGAPPENAIKMEPDQNGWLVHVDPRESGRICFSSVSLDEGEAWIRKFPLHSSASFMDTLTYAGYNDVPVSYLVAEDDLCIPASTQTAEIEMIEKEGGKKVDVTSAKVDHVPNETATKEVADWISGVMKLVASTA